MSTGGAAAAVPAATLRDALLAAVGGAAAYCEVHGENLDALLIGEVRADERRWRDPPSLPTPAQAAADCATTPSGTHPVSVLDSVAQALLDDLVADAAGAATEAWASTAAPVDS
ncbi:hypothetical protein HK405_013085 [Cladochytrium tenue]|nr:hypothetical protein HK405_013085 [Cladochytrium tenue]